jgi:hypothetical protein
VASDVGFGALPKGIDRLLIFKRIDSYSRGRVWITASSFGAESGYPVGPPTQLHAPRTTRMDVCVQCRCGLWARFRSDSARVAFMGRALYERCFAGSGLVDCI